MAMIRPPATATSARHDRTLVTTVPPTMTRSGASVIVPPAAVRIHCDDHHDEDRDQDGDLGAVHRTAVMLPSGIRDRTSVTSPLIA